jgi:hypothetical protein
LAAFAPLADIMANEDWKGSDIVPENIKRSEVPAKQYTTSTTELAVMIGDYLSYSPAKIDHILNSYTGGLYRRLAKTFQAAKDPSEIAASGDLSTIPVAGTMFLRPGTSRVTGDFYDRLDELRQKKGSGEASIEEIGELANAEKLNRSLEEKWAARREIITSGRKASERRAEADILMDEVHDAIKAHQAGSAEDYRKSGAARIIYAATAPGAEEADKDAARDLLAGMSDDDLRAALQKAVKNQDGKTKTREASGKLTAYGLRLARLRALKIE